MAVIKAAEHKYKYLLNKMATSPWGAGIRPGCGAALRRPNLPGVVVGTGGVAEGISPAAAAAATGAQRAP